MELFSTTIGYGLVLLVIALVYFNSRRKGKFPPGPPSLPLIGHVGRFEGNSFSKMHELHKKYGKTIYLRMGMEDVVV